MRHWSGDRNRTFGGASLAHSALAQKVISPPLPRPASYYRSGRKKGSGITLRENDFVQGRGGDVADAIPSGR